ncbi:TPA: DUF551 domain-containing protein, partial [Mannheimia haemolytica]|nr:DUF551 domain-containing protein [Mannheimia haemolytica]
KPGGFLGIQPVYGVTHWQPLPEPPKEKANERN